MKAKDKRYLQWVAELSCSHCDTSPVQVHHLRDIALGTGQGLRAEHFLTLPVCYTCHLDCHNGTHDKETQFRWVLQTIKEAVGSGIIKIS